MQCDQVERCLEQYVEGSLPGYKAAWVVQHLAGCPACTAAAEGARRRTRVSAPPAVAPEQRRREAAEFEPVQRPVPRWLQWVTAILIVGAAGGAIWLMGQTWATT